MNRENTRSKPLPNDAVGRDGSRQASVDFRRIGRSLELVNTTIISNVNKGVVTSSSAAEGLYAFSFALSDCADNTNYSSVWDQYRLKEVDIIMIPLTLQSTPSAGPSYALCYVAPDYDDATTPAIA
jgi:hypothetical protein